MQYVLSFVWANEASDFGLCLLSSISGAETAKKYGVPKMGHFIKYWTRLCRGIFFLPCPNRNKKVKVLVIQQKRIGDVLVGTSICESASQKLKSMYMIYHFTRDVVKHNPNIDKVISFADRYRNPVNLLRFAAEVRRERYDILIDAYEKLESWVIARLSGAPIRIS